MSTSAIVSTDPPLERWALNLVKQFFVGGEWGNTTVNDIKISKITGGFVNRLFLVARSTPAVCEPAHVLVRFFGTHGHPRDPPESTTTLSAAEQAIVYYELGRLGLGPKLYGTFPGGRLEEWIDAHTLTPEESKDPDTRHDIARSYARLHHCHKLPLRKLDSLQDMLEELKSIGQRADEFAQVLLLNDDIRTKEFADILINTDWVNELEWVSSLIVKHQCRYSFAIGDANYLNILIKNYESECRVMLIDYETLRYTFRGFDLGGHFNERMYCYNNEDNVISGHPSPDLPERISFCESYLQQLQDLGMKLNNAIDNTAHLLLESQIGRLFHILFSVLMCFNGEVTQKPALLAGLTHMMGVYCQLKTEFS